MPKFGRRSLRELKTCHKDLQDILNEAIKYVDFSVLQGNRDEETQNKYFEQGKSKLKYPNSKHNPYPSLAVDLVPYPIDWGDIKRIGAVAFVIKGIAFSKGIKLRLGVDWNSDYRFTESFVDSPHIELHSKLIDGEWVRY